MGGKRTLARYRSIFVTRLRNAKTNVPVKITVSKPPTTSSLRAAVGMGTKNEVTTTRVYTRPVMTAAIKTLINAAVIMREVCATIRRE